MRLIIFVLLVVSAFAAQASERAIISVYAGAQSIQNSRVESFDLDGDGSFSFNSEWENDADSPLPRFGVRYTRWVNNAYGWGIDFNRTNFHARKKSLTGTEISSLSFSGGLNLVTVNAHRRWSDIGLPITPYVSLGLGLSIPQVNVEIDGKTTQKTQIGGGAVQWVTGASYHLSDRFAVFGEYQGSYSMNRVDLLDGGNLNAPITTNAVNIGVSLGF